SGCSVVRAGHGASGFTSRVLCTETFVSQLDPDRVFAERVKPNLGSAAWLADYKVDKAKRTVIASLAGGFAAQSIYRDEMGCLLVRGDAPTESTDPRDVSPAVDPLLAPIAGAGIVECKDPAICAALDRIFQEPPKPAQRFTRAVVVVHDGRIIAERYAPGVGIDTPLLSFSVAKSVMNALVGILVRQGRLAVDQPAPLPAWRDPADPRHAITIEHLLRQTSGLALTQTNSGFDPATRMSYIEPDPAAFAQSAALEAKPGTRWAYTDGNYVLLSRIVRDAVGGHARDVIRFAQRELFQPLGMRNVTIEFDATGTPIGSASMLASARDWARFGLLYLNDGVVGAKRILPAGWVRYSTSPTLDTGYGAGFFLNVVNGNVPGWGATPWGMTALPRDTFFARGYMQQSIVIVPSERLVVARFSASYDPPDVASTERMIADIIDALRRKRASTSHQAQSAR
ncbi:MAG: serine hydrolase domain-containing protein, partial [Sulfurifustaceae bacterium]